MTGLFHEKADFDKPTGGSESSNWRSAGSVTGFSIVGLVFVLLAALTWRKWPDPIIDFGTQLYIPWRLSEGAVLYRDLFYFAGGPLSQYFNALLFKIFGVSFSTLIAVNLLFSAAILWYIYRRFAAAADVLTATVICLGIVVAFTFSEYTGIGNYNYIAPYSHEAVHGVFLSLLTVGVLSDWLNQQRLRTASLAGFCAGLVFLTKPDIFVALLACSGAALLLHWFNRREIRFALKSTVAFGVALLAPALGFFLFFLRVEDWRTSLHSTAFGWVPVFQSALRNNRFYQWSSGMDQPVSHLREMALHFLCASLTVALCAVLFRAVSRWKSEVLKLTTWLVVAGLLLLWAVVFPWVISGSSLPLWCLAGLCLLAWLVKLKPGNPALAFPFLWAVFALLVMAKLGVYPRLSHYGFALAMPAVAFTLYFLMWLAPKFLQERYRVPANYLRGLFLLILLAGFGSLFNDSQKLYHAKGRPYGQSGDQMMIFGPEVDVGEGLAITLDWVNKNIPADGTLAVLPSGVTLNYLTRKINPTPCLFWDANSLAVFGQANMTARFEAAPPDYLVIVDQDQSDLGGYFGTTPGFGVNLMQWVEQNYKAVLIIGNEPLKGGPFGVKIYKRLPSPPEVNNVTPPK